MITLFEAIFDTGSGKNHIIKNDWLKNWLKTQHNRSCSIAWENNITADYDSEQWDKINDFVDNYHLDDTYFKINYSASFVENRLLYVLENGDDEDEGEYEECSVNHILYQVANTVPISMYGMTLEYIAEIMLLVLKHVAYERKHSLAECKQITARHHKDTRRVVIVGPDCMRQGYINSMAFNKSIKRRPELDYGQIYNQLLEK